MTEDAKRIYDTLKNSKSHKRYRERMIAFKKFPAREITAKLKRLSEYLAAHPLADWALSYAGVFGLSIGGFVPTDPTDDSLPTYVDTGDEAVMPSSMIN